ncbi:MAG: twin-arginine translocation signal domain-containing protein, partial [Haloarculaceae archaeon]
MTEDSTPTTDGQPATNERTAAEKRAERAAVSEGSTTRRNVLKAGAVGAATAALAGCSALLGGDESDEGSTDVGTDTLEAGLLSFTQGAA